MNMPGQVTLVVAVSLVIVKDFLEPQVGFRDLLEVILAIVQRPNGNHQLSIQVPIFDEFALNAAQGPQSNLLLNGARVFIDSTS